MRRTLSHTRAAMVQDEHLISNMAGRYRECARESRDTPVGDNDELQFARVCECQGGAGESQGMTAAL